MRKGHKKVGCVQVNSQTHSYMLRDIHPCVQSRIKKRVKGIKLKTYESS